MGRAHSPKPSSTCSTLLRTALTAFRSAGVTLITNTNNHGEDCGPAGLQMALQARQTFSGFPIIGIGQNVNDAFRPYLTTINGEKIAIIAATQVIDSDLQSTWTATPPTQAGLASAYDVDAIVAEIEAVRPTVDTVIVYLHWGTELQNCPNALQEPLAQVLVKAGAEHHRRNPRSRPPRRRLSRRRIRRLRARQFCLLRQRPARERQRITGHHRHRASYRQRHLAAGGHRR